MKQYIIIGIALMLVISGGVGAYVMMSTAGEDYETDNVSDLAEATSSPTFLPTSTSTITAAPSPTSTSTPSITPSPTATATLAVRVAETHFVMSDVTLRPTATPLPANLNIIAEPPEPIEPLFNATMLPFPYMDFTNWVSFESDHPAMRYISGNWTPIGSEQASQGQYHYTEDRDAVVNFTFNGEALRVRYVAFTNGGIREVAIDGEVVDTIDTYAPIGTFTGTQVYYLGAGEHTLELHNIDTANEASTGNMIAFDAVQVYRPDDLTLILPSGVLPTDTPTPTLVPAQEIELVQAPPSLQPTTTDIPIQVVGGSIVIGYDENANGVIDVSEGVRGISVRLVEVGTNRIVAHAFTDEQGFAQVQASTNSSVQLVVPYFGESWSMGTGNSGQTFTLLLSPGNQPGLIP